MRTKLMLGFTLTILLLTPLAAESYVCPLVVSYETEMLIDANGLPSRDYVLWTEIRIVNLLKDRNRIVCQWRDAEGVIIASEEKVLDSRQSACLIPDESGGAYVTLQSDGPIAAASILRAYRPAWQAVMAVGVCKFDEVKGEELALTETHRLGKAERRPER